MKNLFITILILFPVFTFAQTISTIEAPIGFLRNEPNITATIISRIPEKEQVKVLERINQNWLKVAYVQDRKTLIGYLTTQTLGEVKATKKYTLAVGPQQ